MTMPDINIMFQFAFATLLPVVASVIITLLERRTRWQNASYWTKQITYGLVFGAIAILGTEAGIVTNDATMNVRDAAPLVAGLYFGGPAGIIAGIIGGVERWFAALWGSGMFTRVACSVATICAGFYAAAMRKYLFQGKRPSWSLAYAIGTVVEVLHMLLIFATNIHSSAQAYQVVRACTPPMVLCNAISVALSSAAIAMLEGKRLWRGKELPEISQRIRTGMLAVVGGGFVAALAFAYLLQTSMIMTNVGNVLARELEDTESDIKDASDAHLIDLAKKASRTISSVDDASQETVEAVVDSLDLAELHVVDENGIIVKSSVASYVGYDMSSGEQSGEFLELLPDRSLLQMVQDFQPISKDRYTWRKYAGVRIEGGFLQVGYDPMRFMKNITDEVRLFIANRHIGSKGLLFVFGDRESLIAGRKDVEVDYWDVASLSGSITIAKEGEVFKTDFHDEDHFCMYSTVEGLHVLAMMPASEAMMERDLSVMVTSFMDVVVFASLFVAIFLLVQRVVVKSIWQVNERLGEITRGDLEVEVDVRDSVEFASLSDGINETVGALRDAIAAESARIERDLTTARSIQESALPSSFPPFPDVDAFDIFAMMNPAKEVGGDFYDFFLVDDHTLGFLIADVSGKGIPGALFMMAAKSELNNYIKSGMELGEAVQSANWNLCQHNDAGMFVTAWVATLDFETGRLTYVNAGHNPPLLRHEGKWQWLRERGGLILATFDMARYRTATIDLVEGDELLLYTDGVNEAFSVDGEEYGNQRLEDFLAAHANLHPQMLAETLRSDVERWAHGAEQSDDITILALEYGKPPEVTGSIVVPATGDGLATLKRRVHHGLSQLNCPEDVQKQLDRTIEHFFKIMIGGVASGAARDKGIEAMYRYDAEQNAVTVSLADWGRPYDLILQEPLAETSKDQEYTSTTGMDDIAYVRDGERNVVAFRKAW